MRKRSPKKAAPAPDASRSSYETEKLLRDFASLTSGRLGHLLGATVGELQWALRANDPQTLKDSLSVALKAAERALGLARNLKYFASHGGLSLEPVELSQLLLDTVDIVEPEFSSNNIRVNVYAEASTFISADAQAFRHIILNLLYCSKDTLSGGGTITLSLRKLMTTVEIKLVDNGKGIEATTKEDLFEPTFQTAGSPRIRGLGLAVAKALTEDMNGTIEVETAPGKGTCFFVTLPFDAHLDKNPPFTQKRRFRRIHVQMPACITLASGAVFESELRVLSTGGAFLKLPEEAKISPNDLEQPAKLVIRYFDSQAVEIPKCWIADVCWMGPHRGAGISFEEIPAKAQVILSNIVQGHAQ